VKGEVHFDIASLCKIPRYNV